jgi:hypothetical protein
MRASLLHPLRVTGHSRRQRRAAPVAPSEGAGRAREAGVQRPRAAVSPGDPAVERVRKAGGPIDRASYTCTCGYLFSASVSTSVMCPHCGTDQAW